MTRNKNEQTYKISINPVCAKANPDGVNCFKVYCRHMVIDEKINDSKKEQCQIEISAVLLL